MSTDDRGPWCVHCHKTRVLIAYGTCEQCKRELRVENRNEYFEALSWEVEQAEGRRR